MASDPAMPSWRLSDELWTRWMVAARTAWCAGDTTQCEILWQAASQMAEGLVPDDPRRGASLHTISLLCSDIARRLALLEDAINAWLSAEHWIETMGTAQSARSSMFHLRLEKKHPDAYPEIVRQRHRKTLAAGRSAAMAQHAALARDRAAMAGAMVLRRDAFGHRETEAAAMATWLGEPIGERLVNRFEERPPPQQNDEARLYAAALLVPLDLTQSGAGHAVDH
ncbi:MAG: hypothetical protein P8Q36_16855 [Alphaproteobacteria bacterium]|nr:hypothetical protein [Alphaproteobacteria bacterium]